MRKEKTTYRTEPTAIARGTAPGAKPIRARLPRCWATAAFIRRSTIWRNGIALCASTRCSAKRRCVPLSLQFNPPADQRNFDDGTAVSYGFGWFLDPYKGHTRMFARWQHHWFPHHDPAFPRRSIDDNRAGESGGCGSRSSGAEGRRSIFGKRAVSGSIAAGGIQSVSLATESNRTADRSVSGSLNA